MKRETKGLAAICIDAAEKASDSTGFVVVRRLVETFGAELEARPLLYEGMIAAPKSQDFKWRVLIDSEQSGFDPGIYANEKAEKSLPSRLRFTVAHELAHMLRFRAKELGVDFQLPSGGKKSVKDAVKEVERETDQLSPLLLISEPAFESRFASGGQSLSLSTLCDARKHWAVSREVLLNRFNLLHAFDPKGLRYRTELRNVGVGIAQWTAGSCCSLLEWPPLFTNFENGLAPDFFLGHPSQRTARCRAAFQDVDFCLAGGRRSAIELKVYGGTEAQPRSEEMLVRIEVEEVTRSKGSKFFFIVERK